MKRFLSIFLAIFALTLAACTSSEEENGNNSQGGGDKPSSQPEVTITTPPAPTVSEKGGNDIIAFHAEKPWSAKVLNTRAEGWCSIYPTSGQAGDVEITITTAPNDTDDDRSATIIIQAGSTQIVITITQKQQDALTVTASKFEVEAEGGEVEIEVKANVDYDYTIDPDAADWVKYKATRALESSTLVFEVAENEDMEKREAQIMIHSGDLEELVTIYQEGNEPTIILSKNEYTVSDKGETIAVEVKSNVDVAVEIPSDVDWVKENNTRAMSTNTFYLDVAPNEDYKSRSAAVKFTNKENGLSEIVMISQAQMDAIVIAKDSYTIDNEGGEIDIEVGHNVDFDVEISDSWITKTSTRAFETETLTFTIAANNSDDGREGTIKFISKDKSITQTVKVFQSQSNALIVSKKDIVIDEKEQSVEFEVRANVEYTVSSSSASWLHREDTRAMTSQTIRYRVDANNSYDSRTATITVQSKDGSLKETITITQAQKDAIVLAKNSYTVDNDGGEIDIEVGHNVDFDIEISDSWITKTSTRAFETETLTFTIAANNSDDGREGTIKFISKDKSITQTVKIEQESNYDPTKPRNNEIWYTSTDGNIVTPNATDVFDANIVSNTYKDGKGIITFDGNVTSIGWYAFERCSSLTSITIPDSVTEIGSSAFFDCSSLTSVTIPDSVTYLGDGVFGACNNLKAFYGKFASNDNRCLIIDGVLKAFAPANLTSYTISDSVTQIGQGAFYFCSSLTTITIPDSVTEIGDLAFESCSSLTSTTIPNSVTKIGGYAFYHCSSLTSITIPDSVTKIGWDAFTYCNSLKSVYCKAVAPPAAEIFDSSWEAFNSNASDRKIYVPAESVAAYKAADGWKEYADAIVADTAGDGEQDDEQDPTKPAKNEIWYTSTDGNIVTPNATDVFGANIASNTYENGKGIITFDGNVTEIGSSAFEDCSSLTSVIIPNGVLGIGPEAFYKCSSLTSVTIPNSVTSIGGHAFAWCNSLTNVTIPDSVTEIGDSAFYSCGCLTNVTIPNSVTTIGVSAFDGCSSLTSVTIGNSVTEIGWWAFQNCSSLTSVTIGNSVTTIGNYAFKNCSSLTSITIPDSVTEIGVWAFSGCSSLKEFKGKFAADGGRCLIKDNTIITYAEASGTTYTIPDSVTSIGDYAFWGYSNLTSVTIPDSVTEIGLYAFKNCSSLTSVYCKPTTPPTLLSGSAFDENAPGRKIYVPKNSVTAYKAADGWKEYADAIVADTSGDGEQDDDQDPTKPRKNEIWYTSADGNIIEPYATNDFGANIVSNTYENGKGVFKFDGIVTKIRDFAFDDCSSLTSITIPDSVTEIGNFAFRGCSSLTSIVIPNNVTSIGQDAFQECSFTNITIPDSVISIGEGAFTNCSSLKAFYGKFATADNRALIVNGTFNALAIGCGATSYTIPNSVTKIGEDAFSYCSSLTSITIPDSVTEIGGYAFFFSSLSSVTIGNSVTTIGNYAFCGCSNITSITIPKNTTAIGDYTFFDCSSLKNVYCKPSIPPKANIKGSSWKAFDWNASGRKIYVPYSSVAAYKAANGWNTYTYAIAAENGEDDIYSSTDYSQDGKVTKLQSATKGNGINIVLMGDAFTDRLIADGTYEKIMRTAMEKFFTEEPYKSYRDHFNVYSVAVVSKNEIYGDGYKTAFSGFFGEGTNVGGDDNKVFTYAQKAISADKIDKSLMIVMMNSTSYAGTCYMYYTSTGDYGNGASISYFPIGENETALEQTLHHEAGGHGFAKLGDEYAYEEYGTIPAAEVQSHSEMEVYGWWKNVDFTNNTTRVKWAHFLSDTRYANDGLGVFEGGLTYWRGVWRPTENSIMRHNTGGFNAPSREAIYYRIHKLAYGDSWQYDYEAFVEWDAKNRKTAATRGVPYRIETPKNFKPLAPPVVIEKSWRDAK